MLTDTLSAFEELKSSSIDVPQALDESDDDIVECSVRNLSSVSSAETIMNQQWQ